MTAPGSALPPSPGWWVRTDRVGINTDAAYGWTVSAVGGTSPIGNTAASYGWTGVATGISHVAYSATGAGNFSATGAPTWSHIAAPGDYVVVGIAAYLTGAFTAVTYGGTPMTFLGYKYDADFNGYGFVAAYGFLDVAGGTRTIATTRASANAAYGNSVSYKGVGSARAVATSYSLGTTSSQPVGMPFGQSMAVQMFHSYTAMAPSGGTNRVDDGNTNAFLTISDATTATTFSTTMSNSVWAGLSLILTPVPVGTGLYVKGTNTSCFATNGNVSDIPIPPPVSGDLIVLYAYRQDNTTAPTKPAAGGTVPAWVDIDNNVGANTNSSRTVQFVASASTTTSGTWTNAHCMAAIVLSGQHATPIGGHAESGSTANNGATAPSVTMSVTNGTSVLLHFFARQPGTYSWSAPPAGYSQYASSMLLGGSAGVCIDIKDSTTADGAVTNATSDATSLGYRGATVEILD